MQTPITPSGVALAFVAGFALIFSEPASGRDAFEDFAALVALKESKQTDTLVALGKSYLETHPGSAGEPVVLLYLGQAYHGKKQHDDAIEVLSKLLEQHSDSELATAAAMQRGESYRLTEKHAEMIPDFQRAYAGYKEAGDETAAHAQYHIVQGYNSLGQKEKATEEAKQLQKDYPSTSYAKNAAQLMKLKPVASKPSPPRGLPVGSQAPDIEMFALSGGDSKKLSDYKGKVVVVDFWASWCGPCQAPMAKMQTYRDKHPEWGDKVELIALSIDNTKEAASGHLESRGWDQTTNFWAGEGGFRSKPPVAYNVRGIPAAYVIDPEGKITATGHPASMDIPEIVGGLLKD